jgi:hypothetical protein
MCLISGYISSIVRAGECLCCFQLFFSFSNVRSGVFDTAFHLDIAITFVAIHTVLLFKSALLGAIFKYRDRDKNEGVKSNDLHKNHASFE